MPMLAHSNAYRAPCGEPRTAHSFAPSMQHNGSSDCMRLRHGDLPTRSDVNYVVRQPPSITRTQMLPAWPKWIAGDCSADVPTSLKSPRGLLVGGQRSWRRMFWVRSCFASLDTTRGESRGLVDHSGLNVGAVGTHIPAVGADRVVRHAQVDRLADVERTQRRQRTR